MRKIRNISNFKPFKQEPNGITAKYWIKIEKRTALYKESRYPSELKDLHDRLEANKNSGTPLSRRTSSKLKGVLPKRTKEAFSSGSGKQTHIGEEPIKFHVGEHIYSQLCKKVGIPCAKIEIVKNKRRIGCLSYDVREDISGVEFAERYILNSIDKIISNAEETYTNETATVEATGERYSLELIERSLRKIKNIEPEEADRLVKQLISVCLMDCLTNYNDRHTKNFAIVFDKKTGKALPIGTFDNGECLALRLSAKDMEDYLNGTKDYDRLMELCQSRIGSITTSLISFDELLDHVFFYYYRHADETAKAIIEKCTEDSIDEIIANMPGPILEPAVQKFIKKELLTNVEKISNKYEKYKTANRYRVNTYQNKKPEEANKLWADLIRKVDKNVEFDETIFGRQDIDFLHYLQKMQESYKGEAITDFDRKVVGWAFIYTKITQSLQEKGNTNYNISKIMDDLFHKELGIPSDFMYQIAETSKNFQRDVSEMDAVKMKMITDEYYSKAIGVRIMNQTLLMYKCRALTQVGKEGIQDYQMMATYYTEMNELSNIMRRQKLAELFTKNDEPYGVLKEYGITEKEDITRVMFEAIKKIKKTGARFKKSADLVTYVINSAKETFKGKKTCIKKWFYDEKDLQVIRQNTIILSNREKLTMSNNQDVKDFDTKAIRLGYSYVFTIGTRKDGSTSFAMTFRNKKEVPKEVLEKVKLIEEQATDKTTQKVDKKKFFKREKDNGEIKYVFGLDDEKAEENELFIKSCLKEIEKNCRRPDMEH